MLPTLSTITTAYDGFPGYPIHPLNKQIQAIELISGKPVVVIAINHENLDRAEIPTVCESINKETGLPTFDVLLNGADRIVSVIKKYIGANENLWKGFQA